jgi:site-specific DNA-methyltransferase (adenine-specific)
MFNKIHNMDCVEGMRMLPDDCIDLTVTSPPYDNLRTYNGFTWDFEAVAKELYRVTKQGGVVVWVVGDSTVKGSETCTSFKQALFFKEIGFNLHDTMIYDKGCCGAVGNNKGYWQSFEYMFVFSKGKPKTINLIRDRKNVEARFDSNSTKRRCDGSLKKTNGYSYGEMGRRTNIWKYRTGKGLTTTDTVAFKHPAMFPEKMANDHIVSWSNEGDVVLDPFMGSGTTAKMAFLNGRNFVGFEISEEYCKIAEERINGVAEQLKAF